MQWILLSLLSAVFLGMYDVAKKSAVRDNAVPPVLLLSVMTAAAIWTPMLCYQWFWPESASTLCPDWLKVHELSPEDHGRVFAKSLLVGVAWTCAYFALKHLPISIASPIRATSPVWTILLAVVFYAERLSALQILGIAAILASFFAFSRVGQREGLYFRRNRWVALMLVATGLGAISAVYDKYLMQTANLTAATVQAWFSIYLVIVLTPPWVYWRRYERSTKPFQFRIAIPLIALLLLVADFAYFTALECDGALVSIISPVRRSSVLIAFAFGVVYLGEKNWAAKLACVAGILLGVLLLGISTSGS